MHKLMDEQARYRLEHTGKKGMTTFELWSTLIGSKYAERIQNIPLNELGKMSLAELEKLGLTRTKARAVVVTFEVGRRRQLEPINRVQVKCSRDAYNHIGPGLADLAHEEFWILLLNKRNEITTIRQVSKGGVSATVVDAKVLFRLAIEAGASSVILVHNHPSGNLTPSRSDIDLTKKLVKAGEALDITVLDHLIVSELGYRSLADEGEI